MNRVPTCRLLELGKSSAIHFTTIKSELTLFIKVSLSTRYLQLRIPLSTSKNRSFDAVTSPAEEFSASTTSRRNGTLISEVETGTNVLPAEVYCICDGTASDDDDDDLGDDDSLRPRFVVLPGESEEDPPRTYRLVYDLKQYARLGWRIPGPQLQSRSRATRKSSKGFMQPKPSRLIAKAQHRAYRARMAYLERQVELAHCLDRLATAANFDEDMWPELRRVLGLE